MSKIKKTVHSVFCAAVILAAVGVERLAKIALESSCAPRAAKGAK